MTLLALWLSLFVTALGATGIVYPAKLLAFARLFDSLTGLWVAAVFRVVFGTALYQSAPTSHAPQILHVLGLIIIAAGLLLPLVGVKRLHRIINGWEAQGTVFTRVMAGVALAFGLLLTFAVVT